MEQAFSTENLSFAYGNQLVLDNVSFGVPKGELLAIIGPNGGGKTTLLKLLLGILSPSSGTVTVLGGRPHETKRRIGYVPQDTNVNRGFPVTVSDVVRMGRLGIKGARRNDPVVAESLERVGMSEFAHTRMNELSGGQRQRVMIARALAVRPEILFLDEPTANIDTLWQNRLYELLRELNRSMTVVVVSHDIGAISRHVTSVACINRTVHMHLSPEITPEMMQLAYGGAHEHCPVEMITHGHVPHRVLEHHECDCGEKPHHD